MNFWDIETDFELAGVRDVFRTYEELCQIDNEIADEAFKNKKKILDSFMKENGFLKYRHNGYLRRNDADALEYVNVQKENYGCKTFTVNYRLISLTIPHTFFDFEWDERLGVLICGTDLWWDYADDDIAGKSFQNVADAIERFLLPWYEKHNSKEAQIKLLEDEMDRRYGKLSTFQRQWLDVLKSDVIPKDVIEKNLEFLKVPASMRNKK